MPPGQGGGGGGGGGGGSKHGHTEQHHPPATSRRDEGAPSLPTPSLPATASQKRKLRQPAAASLPEGPLVEILSRLPYRSLCRFRCVSKQWLALCSDPYIVKRAPQTLTGFFHNHDGDLWFNNSSGQGTPLVDPSSFPFLWCSRYHSFLLDQCSSSLLLYKCWGLEDEQDNDDKGDYIVCNPITGQWTTLPPILCRDEEDDDPEYYELVDPFLGSDPAVPSRFVVLARMVESVDHVAVFSSETGQWTRSSGWEYRGWYPDVAAQCVFLNGMMHFMHLLLDKLSMAAVDTEGKVCREIPLPEGMEGDGSGYGSVGCSQGLLHALFMDRCH